MEPAGEPPGAAGFAAAARRAGLIPAAGPDGTVVGWHGDPDRGGPALVVLVPLAGAASLDAAAPDAPAVAATLPGALAAVAALRAAGTRLHRAVGVLARPAGVAAAGAPAQVLAGRQVGCLVGIDGVPAGSSHGEPAGPGAAGRDPAGPGAAVGVVGLRQRVWPAGRWRLQCAAPTAATAATATTAADGSPATAPLAGRHDPLLTVAMSVLAANKQARLLGVRATVGRVVVEPNAAAIVPVRVTAWLTAFAPAAPPLDRFVRAVGRQARARAARDGTVLALVPERREPGRALAVGLAERLAQLVGIPLCDVPAVGDVDPAAAVAVPEVRLLVPGGAAGTAGAAGRPAEVAAVLAALDELLPASLSK